MVSEYTKIESRGGGEKEKGPEDSRRGSERYSVTWKNKQAKGKNNVGK